MKRLLKAAAFTLCEVLIVIGILGIIAELTIPTLYKDFQKQATVTQLKKDFSELNMALKMAQAENGDYSTWNFEYTLNLTATKDFVNTYIYPYVKTLRKCDNGDTSCWVDTVSLDGTPIGSSYYSLSSNATGISAIMAGGYSVFFSTASGTSTIELIDIFIDVNGLKGPNRLGHDVFMFRIRSDNPRGVLMPIGFAGVASLVNRATALSNTVSGCSTAASGPTAGLYCAALIMADGWQISSDYYWH